MPVAITIRNVPNEVRDELASRAARSGRSLQEYLTSQLAAMAARPDVPEAIEAVRSRVKATGRVLELAEVVSDRDAERR